jgi:glycosyltransferase involved in cell wall biosynthesis
MKLKSVVRLPDLVCLSHLRWNFVFQRPQHLMTRFARERRVFFIEEPYFGPGRARLEITQPQPGLHVVVPHLAAGTDEDEQMAAQAALIDRMLHARAIRDFVLWYYTPIALGFTRHLSPRATVYDCMDELSGFAGAPAALREREAELMKRADLMTTGGHSLYEAKRHLHHNVHAFPSSVDIAHFARARRTTVEPPDQAGLPHPRLGFFGVIDERMDLALLAGLAAARPLWQLVLVGPVVKIDPALLPRAANIHYLGGKPYDTLPSYLAGWDVALMPFARNEATRYISPTKTPEYLAAGRPVVSTSIQDVVKPYGQRRLVRIADTVEDFVAAAEAALGEDPVARRKAADEFLRHTSWDSTWARMKSLVDACVSMAAPTAPAAA